MEKGERDVQVSDDVPEADGAGTSEPRTLSIADLPPGTVIAGKYRIDKPLGQGGMGLVVSAEHMQLGEHVALKFLRVEGQNAAGFRSRFRREAQICARIKNEHILRVIDVGVYSDADYMVMELLEGIDMRRYMRTHAPVPIETAVDFMLQTCDGLAEVHARGVVHRDLKPSNLFVTQRADGSGLIKILDFGISKWATDADEHDEELTKTGVMLGSPKYMAPEQLFGSSTVDARADVWSVGAMLYELLTGRPPFDEPALARLVARLSSGEPPPRPREKNPELTEELDAVVMLCLEPDPAKRLPNVAVLAGELLAGLGRADADATRLRLQRVLDGATTGPTSATISPMKSGEWLAASMLARTGSSPGSASGANRIVVATDVASAAVPAQTARSKRSWALVAALFALALAGVVLLFAMRSPPPAAANASAAPAAASSSAPTAAAAAPTPSAVTTTVVDAAPPATATATAVATKPVAAPVVVAKTKSAAKSESKPSQPAAPPPATATAAPAPTPTPVATAKSNPLDDRQ